MYVLFDHKHRLSLRRFFGGGCKHLASRCHCSPAAPLSQSQRVAVPCPEDPARTTPSGKVQRSALSFFTFTLIFLLYVSSVMRDDRWQESLTLKLESRVWKEGSSKGQRASFVGRRYNISNLREKEQTLWKQMHIKLTKHVDIRHAEQQARSSLQWHHWW